MSGKTNSKNSARLRFRNRALGDGLDEFVSEMAKQFLQCLANGRLFAATLAICVRTIE